MCIGEGRWKKQSSPNIFKDYNNATNYRRIHPSYYETPQSLLKKLNLKPNLRHAKLFGLGHLYLEG